MTQPTSEIVFNGDAAKDIIKGATILEYNHDGKEWHLLMKMPKGSPWAFHLYQTYNGIFRIAVQLNRTKKEATNRFWKEWAEEKNRNNGRM